MEIADAHGKFQCHIPRIDDRKVRKALQKQWPSTCVPASACNAFAVGWMDDRSSQGEEGCAVFYMQFKSTPLQEPWNCLVNRVRKYVDAHPEPTVSESKHI
jgi:hypothetical protein